MQKKDFSEIQKILETNGVGFIKCFFKTDLHVEEIEEHNDDMLEISFSDGINYIGLLYISVKNISAIIPKNHEEKQSTEYVIYLKKNSILVKLVYSVSSMQGDCTISIF